MIGLDDKAAKQARGKFTPSLKGKRVSIQVPELGKYLFLHLKTLKKSTASESIIESTETAWRQFQLKIFELGKPLLFLDRKRSKSVFTAKCG